ncbi:MAG: hypothetical protein AAF743_00625 [Planctomycetota bacterium]
MASGIDDGPLELEATGKPVASSTDDRPHMPEPPPVRLLAVADVHRPTAAGQEPALDVFYTKLLPFEREPAEFPTYRAERHALVFDVLEPPIERESYQPVALQVFDLPATEEKLIDAEIEYEKVEHLTPGNDGLLLKDPAGGWVLVTEWREVR